MTEKPDLQRFCEIADRDRDWLERQPKMTPWDEGRNELQCQLNDWLIDYSEQVCEEVVTAEHADHPTYVDRMWTCWRYHWSHAAEASPQGAIDGWEVADRIRRGRGYLRGGQLGGDPLHDVVLAVAVTKKQNRAISRFQSIFFQYAKGIAGKLNQRFAADPDEWWNEFLDFLAGYTTKSPGKLEKFNRKCALRNWLGTVLWNFLRRWRLVHEGDSDYLDQLDSGARSAAEETALQECIRLFGQLVADAVEVSPEEALDRLRGRSVPEVLPPGVREQDDAAGGRTTDPAELPDEAPQWPPSAEPIMPGPARLDEGTGTEDAAAPENSSTGPILPADSREVTQLVLNRQLTGGHDADGLPGDEGIVVVLEPRDAEGRWLEAPAEVAIVLLDPALEGEAARVARWNFTAAETIGRFCETGGGRGIELTMRWSAGTPQHSDLHLFARYTTSDGRKLQVDAPIRIALPGERSPGWVPSEQRPPERQAIRPAEPPPSRPEPRSRRPVWSPERR